MLKRRQVLSLATGAAATAGTVTFRARKARAQATPVTLTLANSQWLDALRGKNLWAAMLKYQEVAPHVTLKQEAIPAADIDVKLMTELGGGQGPDIAIMQDDLFFAAADGGFLIDVNDAVKGSKNLNNTNPAAIVGGKRLGIGWQRAVYAMIYNKPLIDQAGVKVPTNVDELIASAKAVHDKTGAVGFTARHLMNDYILWFMEFQNWAYGYGASWVDTKGKLTINTPEAAAAMAAFKKMYDAKIIPFGDDFPTQRTRFKNKGVGFSIDNSGGTLNIATGGAIAGTDLHATALPFKHPGAHQQLFISVTTRSKAPKEAMAFLTWLVSAPGQQALREASGPDTLATDVPITPAFQAANPWGAEFALLAKTSRGTLIPGHEVDTAGIMRPVMEGLQKVMLNNADPKAVLADAQKQVDAKFG